MKSTNSTKKNVKRLHRKMIFSSSLQLQIVTLKFRKDLELGMLKSSMLAGSNQFLKFSSVLIRTCGPIEIKNCGSELRFRTGSIGKIKNCGSEPVLYKIRICSPVITCQLLLLFQMTCYGPI